MKLSCFAAVGAALLLLGGCATEQARNIENSKQLRVGMTKVQVLKVMGDPLEESFCTPDCWFYFIEPVWADGLYTEEECMPLVFKDGRLLGWGRKFYREYRAETVSKPSRKAK